MFIIPHPFKADTSSVWLSIKLIFYCHKIVHILENLAVFIDSESSVSRGTCGGKSNKMFIYANTVPYSPTVKCVHICTHASIDSLIVSALVEKANMHAKLHNSYCPLMLNRILYLFSNVQLKQTLRIFLLVFIQMMNQQYRGVDAHLTSPIDFHETIPGIIQVPYSGGWDPHSNFLIHQITNPDKMYVTTQQSFSDKPR